MYRAVSKKRDMTLYMTNRLNSGFYSTINIAEHKQNLKLICLMHENKHHWLLQKLKRAV